MDRLARLLSRYGGLLVLVALGGLLVLQQRGVVALESDEWVQLCIAAATLMLASAAGALALDGREHADLLERHIVEASKLASETKQLAAAALDGLDVSREMLTTTAKQVEIRERAELRQITPNGSIRMAQTRQGEGAAVLVAYEQGAIKADEIWVEVQAWQTQDVFPLVEQPAEPGTLKTAWIETGNIVQMAKMQVACRAAGEAWIYREIHVHFGSGDRIGTNSSVGDWIRDVPDWSWIQPTSGVPNRALGKL